MHVVMTQSDKGINEKCILDQIVKILSSIDCSFQVIFPSDPLIYKETTVPAYHH